MALNRYDRRRHNAFGRTTLKACRGARARARNPSQEPGPPPALDETQRRVWEFLGGGPRSIDELAQRLGLGVPQLSGLLLTLEMKKVVRRLPGNRYERC